MIRVTGRQLRRWVCTGSLLAIACWSMAAEDHARLVRDSEALSEAEQLTKFKVPEGFRIELFADDQQIGGKPINMAFDVQGRLWVTSTREYPYAVPKDKWSADSTQAISSKDTIRILEDTNNDGRADKVTVFADNLNIPTGVLPYKNGCIAWSIPNILYLEDTNADDVADKRTILFGPLGYEKDTHGMISSLRLGLDGWVYATHGFSNTSHFKAKDGSTLDLTSGNVFRFKPDGSRVEGWTSGQVNPFGLCWDSRGNLYSADCHSNPITQLIRGAVYPQFGQVPDPLGSPPIMCAHAHGSTGLCGIVYIDGGIWGPEWDHHMFVGNCVTSRVNHDLITFTGSDPKANEQPDFVTCDDPWFRPVDLQLGPDSALYIADFYNRIIGHYEVKLDHTGRDRTRGRIWRVSRADKSLASPKMEAKTDVAALVKGLDHANLTRRILAAQYFLDRASEEEKKQLLLLALENATEGRSPDRLARIISVLHGCSPEDNLFLQPLFKDSNHAWQSTRPVVLTALLRCIGNTPYWRESYQAFVKPSLDHQDAIVLRAALEAIAKHPAISWRHPLLAIYDGIPSGDATLKHVWKLAAQSVLSETGGFDALPVPKSSNGLREDLFRSAISIPSAASAAWLHAAISDDAPSPDGSGSAQGDSLFQSAVVHIARHLATEEAGHLLKFVRERFDNDPARQLELCAVIAKSSPDAIRGNASASAWLQQLANEAASRLITDAALSWNAIASPGTRSANPWNSTSRPCEDGSTAVFWDSHFGVSETLTGTLRSPPFMLPKQISFWLAGHAGFPTMPPHQKNLVRLVREDNGDELARTYPPRNDTAVRITWTFDGNNPSEYPAPHVYFELTDGDDGGAYAWLAAGGFEPPLVSIPLGKGAREKDIIHLSWLAKALGWTPLREQLSRLPEKAMLGLEARSALAELLAPDKAVAPGVILLARDVEFAKQAFQIIDDPGHASSVLAELFRSRPFRSQVKLATILSESRKGARILLKSASAKVLADPVVSGKLRTLGDGDITQQLDAAIKNLPPENAVLAELIQARLKGFAATKSDAEQGEKIFANTCLICHRVGITGNLVGPQLDGIGARGLERLLEDVLDPNRAVDPAFRLHILKLKDESLVTGLIRREQAGKLIMADAAGQEQSVARDQIISDQESPFSLMPPGFGDVLPESDLYDLMAYLLSLK